MHLITTMKIKFFLGQLINKAKHPISNAVITDILPAGIETLKMISITNEAGLVSAEGITSHRLKMENEVKIEWNIGTETLKVTYQTEVTDFEVDDFKMRLL